MRNGGLEALMHVLENWDYSDIDFAKPLVTSGLVDQVRRSFTAEEKWLETVLCEGRLPFLREPPDTTYDIEWTDGGGLIAEKDVVLASYRDFVPGFRSPPSAQQMGTFIAKHLPSVTHRRHGSDGNRVRVMVFPPLAKLREWFAAARPGYEFRTEETIDDEQGTVVSLARAMRG
jgi:hypothetical protein